jgi:hypothetical protein
MNLSSNYVKITLFVLPIETMLTQKQKEPTWAVSISASYKLADDLV